MPRIVAGLLMLGVGIWGFPGLAQAQLAGTGGTVVGGTGGIGGTTATGLTTTDFFIGVQGEQGTNLTEFDRGRYFNKANCECEKPTWLFVALSAAGLAKRSTITRGTVEIWIGSSCEQAVERNVRCKPIGGSLLLTDLAARGGISVETTAKLLSTRVSTSGGTGSTACVDTQQFNQTVYLLVDQEADGTVELAPTASLLIDVAPPSPPTDITVRGGNEALIVNWKPVNTSVAEAADLLGYQLVCNRAGEFQVFPTGAYSPGYASKATQCPDAAALAGSAETLDPKFLCSGLLGVAATANRIKVLQNFITYGVSVIAIDKVGNPSAPDIFYGNPVASTDFYGFYRNGNSSNGSSGGTPDPGQDQGGFCAVGGASAGGFAALPLFGVGVGALIAGLALARRRRRRR